MKTEEIFKQSGYTIPTDKHDECTKRFDYWDMIAFADLVTEKLKERDSNLALQIVSKRYHFEWENENNETQNFYYSATNEETAMNEFYSHYPNAKMVMVSWKLNVC